MFSKSHVTTRLMGLNAIDYDLSESLTQRFGDFSNKSAPISRMGKSGSN